MSRTSDRLFQEMVSSGQGPRRRGTPSSPHMCVQPAPHRVEACFYLYLDGLIWRDESWIPALQPGQIYTLTVHVTTQQHSPNSLGFVVDKSGLSLSLDSDFPELLIGNVEQQHLEAGTGPGSVLLSRNQVADGTDVTIRIEVPSACCRRRALLNLSCSLPGSPLRGSSLQRTVEIMGEEAWSDELAAIWPVELALAPPIDTVLLYANERESGYLYIDGWMNIDGWIKKRRFDGESLQKPDISLAALVERGVPHHDIVGRVLAFSRERIRNLHIWLKEIRKFHGSRLTVIIVDLSDAEIPWEMIHLGDGYLGALLEVVRWGHFWDTGQKRLLTLRERNYAGNVSWFLAGPSDKFAAERDEISRLAAQPLDSVTEVLNRLSQDLAGIGLLYLGCHGAFVRSESDARRYQALQDAGRPLLTVDLKHLNTRQIRIPAVFANACYTGRLHKDGIDLSGMPVDFLRVAEGYVGTLGEVGNKEAGAIGARVLRAFRESPEGLRVSEILRRLRWEVAKNIDGNPAKHEEWSFFLYTFMYVYYGSPLVRLNLRGNSAGQDDHE